MHIFPGGRYIAVELSNRHYTPAVYILHVQYLDSIADALLQHEIKGLNVVSHKVLQWLDGVEKYIHLTHDGEHLHVYPSAEIILGKFFCTASVNGNDNYCALCND